MDNCIFCQIAAGQLPCHKIYEDEQFLAFLDLFPLAEGHVMVIPKQHYRWVYDIEDKQGFFQVVTRVAQHMQEIYAGKTIISLTIGDMVPHAHYHLIPNQGNAEQVLDLYSQLHQQKADNQELQKVAEKLAIK